MVTAAIWQDFDGDARPDLAVAGQWMPIQLFYNRDGQFTYSHMQALEHSQGLWQTLAVTDRNADGRPDLLAGNLGLNTPYRASVRHPLLLSTGETRSRGQAWAFVLETAADGQAYLLQSKRQLPPAARQWAAFRQTPARLAERPFSELLGESERRRFSERRVVELRNGIWLNRGRGNFNWQPLPPAAQAGTLTTAGSLRGWLLKDGSLWQPAGGGMPFFSPVWQTVELSPGLLAGADANGVLYVLKSAVK